MLRPSLALNKNSFSRLQSLRLVLTALVLVTIAQAQATEKVIRRLFILKPNDGLIFDQQGDLYGTTSGSVAAGENRQYGTVFELPHYPNGVWGNRLLYGFTGAADGMYPQSHLIFDSAGNLYGATAAGGANYCPYSNQTSTCGVVFELMPTPTGQWTEKVIYNFKGGTDGANPSAGVISDRASNLYGTTAFGGLSHGTVFKLAHSTNGTWSEEVLYRFTGGADGNGPSGGLALDRSGNLYGTTSVGGSKGNGTVFELSPAADGTWTFHLLYSFCPRVGCSDGANPDGIILDKYGNLYGNANAGGVVSCGAGTLGCGTTYKLSPDLNGAWTFHLLHTFCSLGSCADGAVPGGELIFDSSGNLYGTTVEGGNSSLGTVFKFSHVPGSPWILESMYSFCALAQCADGYGPSGSLVLDSAGNLYGTTMGGVGGTKVFEIIP